MYLSQESKSAWSAAEKILKLSKKSYRTTRVSQKWLILSLNQAQENGFLEKQSIHRYIEAISGKASILTPNIDEASLIVRKKIKSIEDMIEAAKNISSLAKIPCLIKGGHLPGQTVDILFKGDKFHIFKNNKIKKRVHGTGCFLSSSLLSYMAKGKSLEKACLIATDLTHKAIRKSIRAGKGQHIISLP